jgi:predicted nucleotide-binding protein
VAYYHVRISVQGTKHDEVKTDVDEATLERQVLSPYRTGQSITINGKTIAWDTVERVRISVSDVPSAQLIEQIKSDDRQSSVAFLGGPGYGWRAASRAQDVTDQFITGPPGETAPVTPMASMPVEGAEGSEPQTRQVKMGARAVFVVAGRDSRATDAVCDLLRAFDLQVVEWDHAAVKTGLPNPYVGDVVETGLRMADAAVVLLTPDDLVQLRGDLVRDDDGSDEQEVRGQARPNVYYEAGFADALGRERTVIVEIGNVKSLSDAAGRHVVRYDGSAGKRHALAQRLRSAGLNINTDGQAWLSAGDVEPVLSAARAAVETQGPRASVIAIDKTVLIDQIDVVLTMLDEIRKRAKYEDFSDLPQDSLEFTFRAQALIDRLAPETPYAAEVDKVKDLQAHERIPVLVAALQSLRAEAEK